MTTRDKKERDNAIKYNCNNGNYIFMWETSLYTGVLSVRNAKGDCLWQKVNCTIDDFPTAVLIAQQNIKTDVFETE